MEKSPEKQIIPQKKIVQETVPSPLPEPDISLSVINETPELQPEILDLSEKIDPIDLLKKVIDQLTDDERSQI